MSLLTTRNTYVYKNIRLYFYFRRWYLCRAESNLREFAHTEELSGDGRASEQLFSRNSGTYIVYNSHVTCSNSSFSLTMVMPTSHFFAFHWLCCLLPIGYLPKPRSVGVCIYHYHRIQRRPLFGDFPISSTGCTCFQHNNCGHGDISAITLLILSLSGYDPVNILWCTGTVDMMTFRWLHRSNQYICQQHPPYSHPQVTLIYIYI